MRTFIPASAFGYQTQSGTVTSSEAIQCPSGVLGNSGKVFNLFSEPSMNALWVSSETVETMSVRLLFGVRSVLSMSGSVYVQATIYGVPESGPAVQVFSSSSNTLVPLPMASGEHLVSNTPTLTEDEDPAGFSIFRIEASMINEDSEDVDECYFFGVELIINEVE